MRRWKRAQRAERTHPSHGSINSDRAAAKELFDHHWGVDISALDDQTVLAVGGGTGVIHALERPRLLVSLDPLYEEKRIPRSRTHADVVCGSGEYIPFSDDSFDTVFSDNVMDHTLRPVSVLEEIHRVLRSDGLFLLSVNTFDISKVVRKLLGVVDKPHPHHFSPEEVERMLRSAGFELRRTDRQKHWFTDSGTLSLLAQNEFKKAGGKLARIERFCAVCRLE